MKKFLLILSVCSLVGCESIEKSLKHTQSSMLGLKRTITLFSSNGDTIQTWEGTFRVEVDSGPCISWINDDGSETKVAGTYIVQEVK